MSISTDYESDCSQALNDIQRDLSPMMDADTRIKTVKIDVCFQTLTTSFLWGAQTKIKTSTVESRYNLPTTNNLDHADIYAFLNQNLEKLGFTLGSEILGITREVIDLLSHLEWNKYPKLIDCVYKSLQEADDESLFAWIVLYRTMPTALHPSDHPEKIKAQKLAQLSVQSPEIQTLLAFVRDKVKETSPMDLMQETHTFLNNTLSLLNERWSNQQQKHKALEEILPLSIESDRVRQLITLMCDEIVEKNQQAKINAETNKVVQCFNRAVARIKDISGEKKFLRVDVTLVCVKRSDSTAPEFVYKISR